MLKVKIIDDCKNQTIFIDRNAIKLISISREFDGSSYLKIVGYKDEVLVETHDCVNLFEIEKELNNNGRGKNNGSRNTSPSRS